MLKLITIMGLLIAPFAYAQAPYGEVQPVEIKPSTPIGHAYVEVNVLWDGQWPYYLDLVNRESNWDNEAQNPTSTAYGIGQFLDSTWDDVGCTKTKNPYIQIDCMILYIQQRYGNPQEAIKHHDTWNWY